MLCLCAYIFVVIWFLFFFFVVGDAAKAGTGEATRRWERARSRSGEHGGREKG